MDLQYRMLFVLVCLLIACTYDNEEDEMIRDDCSDDDISYSAHIVPLLEASCYGCHGNGIGSGGVTLEGYEELKNFIDNGLFLGAVKHESGFTPMPQNAAMLPECQIRQIESWIDDGAQNN